MANEPALGTGDNGDWVAYLHQMLEYHQAGSGFSGDTYDETTEAAVRSFQQSRGLETSGRCEESTWAALTGEQSTQEPQASTEHGATGEGEQGSSDITIAFSIQDSVTLDAQMQVTEVEPLPGHAQANS